MLEHTPSPRQTLHEMARALKPGGQLMIIVPTMWKSIRCRTIITASLLRRPEFAGRGRIRGGSGAPAGRLFLVHGPQVHRRAGILQRGVRVLFWPFLVIPFGFLLPILCTHLDWLDRDKYYTIGQLCFCRRVREPGTSPHGSDGAGILP